MNGLRHGVVVCSLALALAATFAPPARTGAATLSAPCPPGYDRATAAKDLPAYEDALDRTRRDPNRYADDPNRLRRLEQMIADLKGCLGQTEPPKVQPTVVKPQQKEPAKPPEPAKPKRSEVEKQLEEIVPQLAKAQDDLRQAKERLAKYNEAAAKQDLGRLRSDLQDDLKRAEDDHKGHVTNLALGIPGLVGQGTSYAASLVDLKRASDQAKDAVELAKQYEIVPTLLDGAVKAPPQIQAGWDQLNRKSTKGERLTREDFEPLVEGTVSLVGAFATAAHNPLKLSEATIKNIIPHVGFWMTAADTLINASLVATSQARYWEVHNNLTDVENAQQSARQRFEIDIRKAEMREKYLREKTNRWRDMAAGN